MIERTLNGLFYRAGCWPLERGRPTLVFIHGAGGSSRYWENQLDSLLDVANTLALDLPGHGESPGQGHQSVGEYTRAVVDWVKELTPPRPVPVGFSMGGAIAQQALLDHPELFAAGVLVATGAKLGVAQAVFDAIENDFASYVEMKGKIAASPQTSRDIIQPVLDDTARQDPQVVLGDFRACHAFDVRARIPGIQAPVLIVSGEDDLLTPPKFSQWLQDNIAGARRFHLQAAGHLVSVEKSEEVNRAIRDFVKKL